MKDKIGTTDIKILVDRLDFGEKHGKDTDAMTKNWLTSSKAYLDDVIRKKRESDGYYIHQDSNETHLCELMEWTQDNPYARDLLQTKIALARHYIGRRGFADDFKELRANVLAYLKNYFFRDVLPVLNDGASSCERFTSETENVFRGIDIAVV